MHGISPEEDRVEEIVAPLEGVPHFLTEEYLEVRRMHVRLVDLGCSRHNILGGKRKAPANMCPNIRRELPGCLGAST